MKTLMKILRDRRGAAAVEFAFVVPILAGLAVASYGVWEAAARQQNMRSALRLGTQYYINGGSNDAAARTVALAGWSRKPEGGDIAISRMCRCGDDVVTCTTLCAASKPPAIYVTLAGSATTSDAMFNKAINASKVIRVR